MVVFLLEKKMKKQEFKALITLMGGEFKIAKFKDGYAYRVAIQDKFEEEYQYESRTKAYLDGKKAFKKLVGYANHR